MPDSTITLQDRFAALDDPEFLSCWKVFRTIYRSAFLGGLSPTRDFGDEWCFLTMEVMRGVGRIEQMEQLANTTLGPLRQRVAALSEAADGSAARQGALVCELLIALLEARLRGTDSDPLSRLFESLSLRGSALGTPALQPIAWGEVDLRPFLDGGASSSQEVFGGNGRPESFEDQRTIVHLRHVVALLDSGVSHVDILSMYSLAGWPIDAAEAIVRNGQVLRTMASDNEQLLAGDSARIMLGLSTDMSDIRALQLEWPPALHRAGIFNTTTRRQLNSLARVIREALRAKLTTDEIASRMTSHGIDQASAQEFVDFIDKFYQTLERGLDYSAVLAKADIVVPSGLLGRKLKHAERRTLLTDMVAQAGDTSSNARGFVLYLRSFDGDEGAIPTSGFFMKLFGRTSSSFYEQIVAGPLINKRGLPFAMMSLEEKSDPSRSEIYQVIPRVQSSNETWRLDVTGAILSSELVFVRFHTTRALQWEIARAFELAAPERLLIGLPDPDTLPGGAAEAAAIIDQCRRCCGKTLARGDEWSDADDVWQSTLFVTFSPDWTPQVFYGNNSESASKRINFALENALQYMNSFV